jgi:NADP-dependent 3-hydroxy acid dehydrogenase YdfG
MTTITLITGANKGLGRETARRLIEQGHTVLLGARDAEAGTVAADELGARFVPIDVTDDESVAAAAAKRRAPRRFRRRTDQQRWRAWSARRPERPDRR